MDGSTRQARAHGSSGEERGTAKSPAPTPSATPRRPQQERGQRRVDAILDAAAELVAAGGIAAATMHRVAQRSRTAIGSMCHFFPDREAVLRALALRHTQALRALTAQTGRETAAHRSQVSTGDKANSN